MTCTGQHRNFATLTTAHACTLALHAPCTLHALFSLQKLANVRPPPPALSHRIGAGPPYPQRKRRGAKARVEREGSLCRGQPGKRPARVERRSFCSLPPHTQLHHPPAARISRMGPRLPPSVVCQPILPPMRSGCYSASMKREKKMML